MVNALETKSVTKIYKSDIGTIRAVDEVSLNVANGEFVALVGPSGSGKTTMLAILAALLRPNEGSVMIDGAELSQMSEAKRARFRREKIGFTFQANNLVPYLTALENVELMLRLNGKYDRAGRERARELLARLGLGERLKNLPRQLSGGQQQRVAIARALIHTPALVLADEPTASLDTERAHQVIQTFANLIHEQQRAGIMVTHDLRMTQYADRIIQMRDGKLRRVISDPAEIRAFATTGEAVTAN
ncbi:MAG: ABC transporter ATP-binding protein [Chloroflexi bacterium]|nr:ABC transporter ATP-binding protein [Chloroflexota bacterium]